MPSPNLHREHKVYGLQTRTLVFLTLFLGIAIYGVVLMENNQERITDTSTQVREVLLPTARLFEQAQSEIDLQIQEISLYSQKQAGRPVGPQNMGLLRLGPSVRSLINLKNSPFLTSRIRSLYQPWIESAEAYQGKVSADMTSAQSLESLLALRQKTHLVQRAIDREFSFQLLNLSDYAQTHLVYWLGALILLMVLCSVFAVLLWGWMRPLGRLTRWIDASSRRHGNLLAQPLPPPPAPAGSGLLAPPREIQELVDALRFFVEKYKDQARELEFGSQRNTENEKAISTLFSASLYLSRHNDELLKELIKNERLASMGEMAAQLAHEIRNPLNSLNLKLELLGEELEEKHRKPLENVLGEIDRLNNLTEEHLLRTRARLLGHDEPRERLADGTHDIGTSVNRVLETLKPELDQAGIEVAFENKLSFSAEGGMVPVPSKPLQAVLHNLIRNAREAIEEARSRAATASRPARILITAFGDKNRWSLEINDTGCGFPDQFVLNEESFHSTKRQGFGIGLATSQKMLKQWKAAISIHAGLPPYVSTVRINGPRDAESKYDASQDTPAPHPHS